jgi:hypothetical protein
MEPVNGDETEPCGQPEPSNQVYTPLSSYFGSSAGWVAVIGDKLVAGGPADDKNSTPRQVREKSDKATLVGLQLKNPSNEVHAVYLYGVCIGNISYGDRIDFIKEMRSYIDRERDLLTQLTAAYSGGPIPDMRNNWLVYGIVCDLPSTIDPQALTMFDS